MVVLFVDFSIISSNDDEVFLSHWKLQGINNLNIVRYDIGIKKSNFISVCKGLIGCNLLSSISEFFMLPRTKSTHSPSF